MGTILLIDDDRTVSGLIGKIWPNENLKIIKALPQKERNPHGGKEIQDLRGSQPVDFNGTFREYLEEEIRLDHPGSIHERIMGKVEKTLIGFVLEEEKGNQVRAAKRLGMNRNTLRKKIKDLGIMTRVVTD